MTGSTMIKIGLEDVKKYNSHWMLNKASPFHFIVCSSSVFVFFLIYGYLLELIFTLKGMRDHGWYMTWIQFGYYTLFALIHSTFNKLNKRRISMKTYLLIAILSVGTMGFSNSSMGYLNYATQVIFKSCKLIPVMICSILILKKRYTYKSVVACLCMCLGLIWFTLADSTVQPAFQLKGVVLICCALVCDAVIGNVQEGAMREHNESPTIVVLYSYSIGFFIIFVILLSFGSITPAIEFSLQHPQFYKYVFLLSIVGYFGLHLVLDLVKTYGALVAVMVTTFRKAVSIALSFFMFTKPFTFHYIGGGVLVFVGVYLNVSAKSTSNLQQSCFEICSLRFINWIRSLRRRSSIDGPLLDV